nr:MATH domain-containing protein At5g43560-like isoform X1 [Tanacetum cinerariifolium]
MAGTSSEESGLERSFHGLSIGQQRYREALVKCRSTEQVENAITPTSSPYWDTDDEDDSVSDLYGNYTWPINKFSKIDDRELRSNVFKVGGYSWYILIYPQGCDVCNHLSLFLCVDRDKLLPGWSQYAQFTVAVVNIDPKKSKYSDTLHRFWKKEHDWGRKKFMKRPNLVDGFLGGDTLVIKAQVQVIRKRADRPFRCLDRRYRREFIRVYFSNVEQICLHFVEEKRGRFVKLIEDRVRWSSFSNFWLGIDQKSRRRMSREKSDIILKVLVNQFFIGKEVTSCFVMDTLNSGLKALEGWSQYAQFTVAVVNIDPKKSKYSDTLHRFWKKEHDWGRKKFMKRPNLVDGFLGGDTLVIKAQVQVIRKRADRPFRCLDRRYRREFIRVYFSNVEQICLHFVEEKRGRFVKLIEDRVRWSSFSNFWLGIDQKSRRRMSREKSDIILKVLVNQFFIGKEVTSCFVMDTLNSGLKALEVGLEPLPPKDEIGPQKCTKDGGSGENFSKVSIEHYERRLTELGRRTIEMFVLSHIFSKIEGAYQEAVALKRQEELIREEEGMVRPKQNKPAKPNRK